MRKAFILFIFLFTVHLSKAQYSWSDKVKYAITSARRPLSSIMNDATKYYRLNDIYIYYVVATPASCFPKPADQGTGLGLSLAYDIIRAHRGEIKVQTREGE
jgi:hypothetical protein